jgi:hypothetical protein
VFQGLEQIGAVMPSLQSERGSPNHALTALRLSAGLCCARGGALCPTVGCEGHEPRLDVRGAICPPRALRQRLADAVAHGNLTPGEAGDVVRVVEAFTRSSETIALEARIAALEQRSEK